MARPPRKTKYVAKLRIVDEYGRFRQYSSTVYYFDKDMQELGYQVNGELHEATKGREWSEEALDKYHIQELR